MKIDDNFYMKLAIDEAWKYQLLTYPNPAVGCVIVKDGKLLAIEDHKEAKETMKEYLEIMMEEVGNSVDISRMPQTEQTINEATQILNDELF